MKIVKFNCKKCNQSLEAEEDLWNTLSNCPACGAKMLIPLMVQPPRPPPPLPLPPPSTSCMPTSHPPTGCGWIVIVVFAVFVSLIVSCNISASRKGNWGHQPSKIASRPNPKDKSLSGAIKKTEDFLCYHLGSSYFAHDMGQQFKTNKMISIKSEVIGTFKPTYRYTNATHRILVTIEYPSNPTDERVVRVATFDCLVDANNGEFVAYAEKEPQHYNRYQDDYPYH